MKKNIFIPKYQNGADGISTFVSSIANIDTSYRVVETNKNSISILLRFIIDSDICIFNGVYQVKYTFLCILSKLLGKKTVVINHGNISCNNLNLKKKAFNFFYVLLMWSFIDRFVVTSRAELRAARKLKPINLKLFMPDKKIESDGIKSNRIVYAGRISKEKRVLELVKAYEELHETPVIDLVLFGSIQDKSFPKIYLKRYFHGHLTHEQSLNEISNSYFSFNLSKSESFGYSIAESLASGTPVIVAEESEWPVELGFGFRVDAKSKASIKNVLERISSLTSEEYLKMQNSGRVYIRQHLSEQNNIGAWRDTFEKW